MKDYEWFECVVKDAVALFAQHENITILSEPVVDTDLSGFTGLEHQTDCYMEILVFGSPMRVVIECKYKNRPVTKETLMAFKSKIDDVEGSVMGMFFSKSGFQIGAEIYAKKHGIRLFVLSEPSPEFFQIHPRRTEVVVSRLNTEMMVKEERLNLLRQQFVRFEPLLGTESETFLLKGDKTLSVFELGNPGYGVYECLSEFGAVNEDKDGWDSESRLGVIRYLVDCAGFDVRLCVKDVIGFDVNGDSVSLGLEGFDLIVMSVCFSVRVFVDESILVDVSIKPMAEMILESVLESKTYVLRGEYGIHFPERAGD